MKDKKVIIFNEFDENKNEVSILKLALENSEFLAPIKHQISGIIKAKRFLITSNKLIKDINLKARLEIFNLDKLVNEKIALQMKNRFKLAYLYYIFKNKDKLIILCLCFVLINEDIY